MRRFLAWAAVAAISLVLVLPLANSSPAHAASTGAFSFNWPGGMTAPVVWTGQGLPGGTWDIQIHKRGLGDDMNAMPAGHGPDCGPPPATHTINMLSDGVYICRNHIMTAINDGGYGEIALTPDHMVDFSSGTASITFNVSTLDLNYSDWNEIWVTPIGDNLTTPTDFGAQGNPSHALRFSLSHAFPGASAGDVARYDNFAKTQLPKTGAPALDNLMPGSAVTRTPFEIDISQTHVRFGIPTLGAGGVWWTDTNIAPLAFTQGVVQITHHSYDPMKHCASCGVDTWHWSNFAISNSVPFSIINGAERSIHPGAATTVHFPAPAPANSFVRFSGVGTIQLSYNGGASWVNATLQPQRSNVTGIFSTYMTAVPAGTTAVMFQGQNWYGGSWWVRDPAIWSAQGISPVVQPPANNPPSNQPPSGGGNPPPVNPPPTSNPGSGEGGKSTPGTGSGTGTGTGTGTGSGSKPGGNPGGSNPGSGSSEGGGGQKAAAPSTSAPAPAKSLLIRLASVLNPRQDPTVNVVLLLLGAGLLFAIYRVIRG